MIKEARETMEVVRNLEPVENFIARSQKIRSIEKLPGDASTRKYYRVHAVTDSAEKSLIVMSMEPFAEQGENIPFLAIQRHLKRAGVDVPAVLDFDPQNGFIMLEDLGDEMLLRSLQDISNVAEEKKLFEGAINALVMLHTRTGPAHAQGEKIEGFQLRFDTKKLMWEVNFTIEHFYQKHLARNISERDMKIIQDGFTQICEELDREPTVFTHRDYHSRNLMVASSHGQKRFVMIDFQDARMGPCQYDLASLLRDSYYQLSEIQIQSLLELYLQKMKEQGHDIKDRAHFDRIFDLMSVQRNFKAIGSFASFLNRRGNPAYLKFVGNTFENIRHNLLKYPEFSALREVLYHYYYF